MRLVPVPLGFTYRLDYIPKGAQKPRAGLFRGADTAVVRHIDPDEAKLAFRVSQPELDILPLARPRTKRRTPWEFKREAMKFEILFYDGCIWWPNVYEPYGTESRSTSAEECLRSIKDDRSFFGAQAIDECYDVATMIPPIRELIADESGERLAQAQRKTYENVLVCGDDAYFRGGMPIYFRNCHGKKSVWEIDIASVGPHRHGDPRYGGLRSEPGSFVRHQTEIALGKGHFWLADDRQAAVDAGHHRQSAFPTIEVLMPELISEVRRHVKLDTLFPEVVNEVKQQIRLDSIFRDVVRMLGHPFRDHWQSRPFRSFGPAFDALCEPIDDNDRLSRQRLELLRSFIPSVVNIDHWEINRIREDFLSFDASQRLDPTWPEEMVPADLDALAVLGI